MNIRKQLILDILFEESFAKEELNLKKGWLKNTQKNSKWKRNENKMTKNKDFITQMILEWKDILIKPNQTLSKIQDRKLYKSTLYIYFACFIAGALYKIIGAIKGQAVFGAIIIAPIIGVIVIYIWGTFLWILGKLLKTDISLKKWLSLFFAAWAPIVPFTAIPYAVYFMQLIYGTYIHYLSFRYFMKLSAARCIFIIVLYISIILIVSII